MVFFVEGYTYEFTDGLVASALKAGTKIGDYELVPLIATMSVLKNAHGWWVGQQSLQDASFNVALESAAKGALAIAGGFVGKGVGALMFGPAGAYVFGGVLAVAATTESHWIPDRVDTALDPDRDGDLAQAAKQLLKNCVGHLEANMLLNKQSYSGERLAISALEFASRCGVHPHWLQTNYQSLLKLLQRLKDRWKKTAGLASSGIRSLRGMFEKDAK